MPPDQDELREAFIALERVEAAWIQARRDMVLCLDWKNSDRALWAKRLEDAALRFSAVSAQLMSDRAPERAAGPAASDLDNGWTTIEQIFYRVD